LAPPTKAIVFAVGASSATDPLEAGKAAARAARSQLGPAPVKAVIVSECFEDKERKQKVLAGVESVFPQEVVFGSATYGSFTQAGPAVGESAAVLAVAGNGISVASAVQTDLGAAQLTVDKDMPEIEKRLSAAGKALAARLPKKPDGRLLIVLADAHSPKNGALVAGIRGVVGNDFPITGGSANKNAGQTFVYCKGQMLTDAAVALLLSGDFRVAQAGRQAKENEKILSTANAAAAEALARLGKQGARPAAVVAFDCAGRKGRVKNVADELAAMQKAIGRKVVLFGTYNAGEIGPPDVSEKLPGVRCAGVGWHVMFTAVGW